MTDICPNCRTPLVGTTDIPSSPVPHLLGTNKVTCAVECLKIQDSIAAVQPAISQLDNDIACVQRVLERLTMERKVLQDYSNDHALLLTLARRVPTDIWLEIFSHCLPQGDLLSCKPTDVLDGISDFSPRHAPTLLLQICSDWRAIAISSPRLWSLIPLHSLCNQVPSFVVQAWLRRSHQAALTVILRPSSDELPTFFHSPAMRAVCEQSHRWQSVSITLPLSFDFISVFSPLKNNLPALEELHIDFEPLFQYGPQLEIFYNAPKLRRVTIYRPPPFLISSFELPWKHLTHFSSKRYHPFGNIAALLNLLHSAPHLLEVEWYLTYSRPLAVTLEHSRLRNLSLFINDDPGSALDNLLLPSLRTLFIETLGDRWFWTWSSFEPFMSRNGRALESFKLASVTLRGADIIPCLEVLPSLRQLVIFIMIDPIIAGATIEELLQALSCTTTGNIRRCVALPRMQTIMISCPVPDSRQAVVASKFIDMIESRWHLDRGLVGCNAEAANHSDISRIELASLIFLASGWSNFMVDPSDNDRLEKLRSEGLEVEVSGRP
jgi:hypothetical protein